MTHSILDLLRNAVVDYGYWAVADRSAAGECRHSGARRNGSAAGQLSWPTRRHELSLPWIIVVATVAATLGDNLGYALGHYGGRPLVARYQAFFRIEDKTLARGESSVRPLRGGHGFLRPLRLRHAHHRRTHGGSVAHAVAQVSDLQLSRRRRLGHGDLRRRLFVRAALVAAGRLSSNASTSRSRLWRWWQWLSGGGAAAARLNGASAEVTFCTASATLTARLYWASVTGLSGQGAKSVAVGIHHTGVVRAGNRTRRNT